METLLIIYEHLHPEYVPYITAAVTVAGVVATLLPPPDEGSNKGYAMFYGAVHRIALNFGHAVAAENPKVAGLQPDQPQGGDGGGA